MTAILQTHIHLFIGSKSFSDTKRRIQSVSPTKNRRVNRFRFGLVSNGLEGLIEHLNELELSPDISNEYFTDEFYDKNAMLERNRWIKKRTMTDAAWSPLSNHEPILIEKVNVDSDINSIKYTEKIQPWEEQLEESLITYMMIHRQILSRDGDYKIFVDRVSFPGEDPYCTCAAEIQNTQISDKLERVFQDCSLSPIRGKIVEYFYRYDQKTYALLVEKELVPDLDYEMSYLEDQWDNVIKKYEKKEHSDHFNSIWHRLMGLSEAPIDECDDDTVAQLIEIMKQCE